MGREKDQGRRRWRVELLSYRRYPLTNAVVEGKRNRVKALKRRAYGYLPAGRQVGTRGRFRQGSLTLSTLKSVEPSKPKCCPEAESGLY